MNPYIVKARKRLEAITEHKKVLYRVDIANRSTVLKKLKKVKQSKE